MSLTLRPDAPAALPTAALATAAPPLVPPLPPSHRPGSVGTTGGAGHGGREWIAPDLRALAAAPVVAAQVFEPIYRRGNRVIATLVGLHLVLSALLAPVHGTWRTSAVVALTAAAGFYAALALRPTAFATRCIAGLALQTFCALHIYQMSGLAEMHFFFFTSVTAMILYQDPWALWPGVFAIIAQHTLFSVLHNAGWHPGGQQFFEPVQVSAAKLGFHFGIALAQTGIAAAAAAALRHRTLLDAAQQQELRRANATLERQGAALEAANVQLHDQASALERTADALEARDAERAQLLATEAEARRSAEEANRAKSAFLATMSHELRTPLNAIGGYVQLLEMELHGPVTDAQRRALERVQHSQRHLLGLINNVLNFAKLEAGRVEYRTEPVPVAEVLADLAPMIEPQLAAKRLAYAVDVQSPAEDSPDDLDACVAADRDKVQQVLLNLLSNAVKFTPAGGRVTVSVRTGAEGAGRSAEVVRIAVADTGLGIAADKLAAIFDPFVQVQSTLTREHGGTGLGLAISRELARGMGGDLTAESTPGAGSTFTLTLPAASAAVACS